MVVVGAAVVGGVVVVVVTGAGGGGDGAKMGPSCWSWAEVGRPATVDRKGPSPISQ